MKRKQGQINTPIIECLDRMTKYAVRWDYRQEQQGEEIVTTFMEEVFAVKPTLEQIKATIYAWINEKCTNAIVTGFTWDDVQIWLSNENQANYLAVHTLLSLGEMSAPVTIRGGHDETPEYITFDRKEDFKAFWIAAREYIDNCVHAAWEEKANFDFSQYEHTLA